MITLNESVQTSHSIERTFEFIGDFSNTTEWDPGVTVAEQLSRGEIAVGTTYKIVAAFAGKKIPMTYEVIEWDPPKRVVLRGEGPAVIVTDDIRFEHKNGVTTIFYRADFEMKGFRKVFEPFMKPLFNKLGADSMSGMDAALRKLSSRE